MTTTYSHDELMEILRDADASSGGVQNFLAPAAAYCWQLNLIETVDSLVPSEMMLRPGMLVQLMVLDTLSGRSPLYHLTTFASTIDRELLLGEDVDPSLFNDTNVGRMLDAIARCGTGRILSALGVEAVRRFYLDPTKVSYDTTSTNVWGSYEICKWKPGMGPDITYGYSKDLRPDLKQFMTELLCVDHGVPIFGSTLDGNSSDKQSNHRILENIAALMKRHGLSEGAFIYIADSSMVTSKNLAIIGSSHFISRLPSVYSACSSVIDEAMDRNQWQDIGSLNEVPSKGNRPPAVYQAMESVVTIDGTEYRAVVFLSDALDKRRLKKLERELKASEEALKEELRSIPLRYACEADALQTAKYVESLKSPYHKVEVEVERIAVRGRGRPPKNGPAKTVDKFDLKLKIVAQEEKVAEGRRKAGCFVLLTNVPRDVMDAKEVLQTYKGQFAVEQNFAFLKDPLIVNDLFLKTPSRIDALGMILIIALMIYRLMQRMMRRFVQETGTLLPGWKTSSDTDRPTSYMLTWALKGIRIYNVRGQRVFGKPPDERQKRYLEGLGLDESVYLQPTVKCRPIIPANHCVQRC